MILVGCRNRNLSIELKRMVIQPKGRGLGRACLRLLKKVAFEDLRSHPFGLDVRTSNTSAKRLYDCEGFVEEGRMRDSLRANGGYVSMVEK